MGKGSLYLWVKSEVPYGERYLFPDFNFGRNLPLRNDFPPITTAGIDLPEWVAKHNGRKK